MTNTERSLFAFGLRNAHTSGRVFGGLVLWHCHFSHPTTQLVGLWVAP
jgi:hypothetical protein